MRSPSLALAMSLLAAPAVAQTTTATTNASATATSRPRLPADSLEIARRYVQWFYTTQAESLVAHLTPSPDNPSVAQVTGALADLTARAGTETALEEERWVRRNGQRQYWRIARFSDFTQERVVLRLVIMPDGTLGGFGFNPESRVPPIDPEP